MGSVFGKKLKISVFGQSHSEAIGVSIDGFPCGFKIDMEALGEFLSRRAPGKYRHTSMRKETDIPEILSGFVENVSCGAPICAIIRNTDVRSADYKNIIDLPRPSHSDYSAYIKYQGNNDVRGGGHFSGRLTAPICIAGGMCIQVLNKLGIHIGAHIFSIADIQDVPINPIFADIEKIQYMPLAVIDTSAGEKMLECIENARMSTDSVGGIVECAVKNVPAGLGEAIFESVESRLSSAIFSIPAVRGIEFGAGFSAARQRGSQHNDEFFIEDEKIRTKTNNHSGILGGITSGMPIIFRAAFKPTASIALEQETVSLKNNTNEKLIIKGRHDPCVVPRAVPVVEAMTAIVMLDILLEREGELL